MGRIIEVAHECGPTLEAIVDRLGGSTTVEDLLALCNQPGVLRLRDRPRTLLPLGKALLGRQVLYLTLDAVELTNELYSRGGNAALLGIHQFHKVTPRMRHTATLNDPICKQRFVPPVVVAHQAALPASEEGSCMFASAADGEFINNYTQRLEAAGSVGAQWLDMGAIMPELEDTDY